MNRPASPTYADCRPLPPVARPDGALALWPLIKSWIRKLPFFEPVDFARRRLGDSPLFDFAVRPLADKLEEWPRALVLDTTNRCNAKCVWCPNPQLAGEIVGCMDMPLYRKIIDDYATRGGIVRFGTFGEPLMDKTFAEKVAYLKRHPSIKKVEMVTNGFFLSEKNIALLIDHGVAAEISLDELDKETFEKVKGMSYDVVRANVLDFLERNDRAAAPVAINFRIKSSLPRAAASTHEFYREIAAHRCAIELTPIAEDPITSWAGRFDKDAFYAEHMRGESIVKKHGNKGYNRISAAPCNQLWKWLVVYWDGRVALCCIDMFVTTVLGDLKNRTIAQVWNGPALAELRQKMVRRRRFDIPLCRDCDLHLGWHNLKEYYDRNGEFLPHRNFIS